ncbi:hypothetical protein CSA56_07480 [candidate division KSB3 bacterium]|uniref:Tetratricopeptide repeat protein n=1 Tax=candidate division KSB3 bacterium TaxID=2044937 RepID=A0A2G6KFV4_9BACT|nr:MAG: hypothetical protein CSA56_07480 [candidate division KSB3 bacterium]
MKGTPYRTLLYLLCLGSLVLFCSSRTHGQTDPRRRRGMARELYHEGVFYGKQGKYIEAESALEKALEYYPAYADAYNALGVVSHRQKKNQQAIEYYVLAIETDPHHVKARTNLALVFHEQRHDEKALRQLEKVLEIHPDYGPAQQLIRTVKRNAVEQAAQERERQKSEQAAQERERQKSEQAAQERERQEKASQKSPPPPVVKKEASSKKSRSQKSPFAAGTKLFREGKVEAGIQSYQHTLSRLPRSAEGYTLLGMAYREQSRITLENKWFQHRVKALTTALTCDARYVPALIGLAELSFEQGDFRATKIYLRDALTYQPDHPAKAQIEAILRHMP